MGIITQEGLPENCDSAYISIYICASFLACLSSSLPGEEEDHSPAMLMMNVPAKLFVLACLFVIISARRKGSEPCKRNEGIESCFCVSQLWYLEQQPSHLFQAYRTHTKQSRNKLISHNFSKYLIESPLSQIVIKSHFYFHSRRMDWTNTEPGFWKVWKRSLQQSRIWRDGTQTGVERPTSLTLHRVLWKRTCSQELSAQLLGKDVGLVSCEDSEGINDLFGCVNICGLAGHEVQEAVELDVSAGIGVDN